MSRKKWKLLAHKHGLNPSNLTHDLPEDVSEFQEGIRTHRWEDLSAGTILNGPNECVALTFAEIIAVNLALGYVDARVSNMFPRIEVLVPDCWNKIPLQDFVRQFNRRVQEHRIFIPDSRRNCRYLCAIIPHPTDEFEEVLEIMEHPRYRGAATIRLPDASLHAVVVTHISCSTRKLVCWDVANEKVVHVSEEEFVEFVLPEIVILEKEDVQSRSVDLPTKKI